LLKINAGFQANNRMEDEGGGHISLNMLLSTLLYNLQWSKTIHPKVEFILSQSSTLENNTNFGARKIIPDAWMAEFSGSGFFKVNLNRKVIAEFGLGLNSKWIKTILTPGVNSADKVIAPFSKNWISANGLAGLVFNPTAEWNIKLNASSGFRAPNLAELSSNGLHEGIFTYEIGDPGLKSEQNINAAADVSYTQDWVSFAVAGFYNRFYNYIYLQPTNRDFYGFPVFLFRQQNAQLYGGEFEWKLTPQQKAKGLEFNLGVSTVIGKTDDGNYLPFIPATRLRSFARYEHDISQKVRAVFGSIGLDYVFQQSKPAPNEKPTGSYYLLSASAGVKFTLTRGTFIISLACNNLLGAKYFDHLSRFKNYGIYNIGRDIVLRLSVPLLFNYSTKPKNKK
ncbi:MAG TPA: TonB-dependent receptor, partial [Chitinophagales bacterium]|nr:TonB-dependent receptor [Chitinophagales bacterium]